jgi:cyclopropane-fatty-acyl-phospholipid synthase
VTETQQTPSLYEVEGDFFRMWMDHRPNLSCGLWRDSVSTSDGDSLDRAQRCKMNELAEFAGIRPGMRVLDIGSGYGGMLNHLVDECGAEAAHGINLSASQCEEARLSASPGVTVEHVDYRDYCPERPFDAAVSIEMVEHVADARAVAEGRQVELYRDFMRRVHGWTRPGALFALEVTTMGRRSWERESAPTYTRLMEGMRLSGLPPHLADLVQAADGLWEPMRVQNHRDDYVRTYDEWIDRIEKCRDIATARWGDELVDGNLQLISFEREAFRLGLMSVAHVSFRRVDAQG